MNNFHDTIKKDIKEHIPKWHKIFDHPYRTLIIGGSGSGQKIHYLSQHPDIDKTYLYVKDPCEEKHHF